MTTTLTRVQLHTLANVRVPALALLLAFGCGPMGTAERTSSSTIPAESSNATMGATGPSPAASAVPPAEPSIVPSGAVPPAESTPAAPTELQPEIIVDAPASLPGLFACETALDASVSNALTPFVVKATDIARRTLYSWTTATQIEELRAEPKLLTRTVSSDGEVGRAQGFIAEAAPSDAVAALLNEPRFENKRYAWSNPWATRLGWTGEDYGDRLLAITLRPEALIGNLTVTSAGFTWAFYDLQGAAVSSEELLAQPERLAAIYFWDQRDMPGCAFERRTSGSMYREYILCNEDLIEGWSAFTPEIRAELDRGIAALQELSTLLTANACDEKPSCWTDSVLGQWQDGPGSGMVHAYEASLAFPNDLYAPTRSNLVRLIERLQAVPFESEVLEYRASASDAADAGTPR